MDILDQYLHRADDIIGERSPVEVKYDNQVLRWLRKGKSIRKALEKANQKFPSEALQVTDDSLPDVQAHYEYLADHERILRRA